MSVLLAAPKVGDRAPEIHLEKLLPEQPVANASFEKFAGKTVVLEMWATWCGPCVAAIPHLNELAEKFKDQPVVFLSVTDEEPEVAEYFLKKHPISGLIGIAHGHSPYSDYGLVGIPGTFLIDSHGRIAGLLNPTLLTAPMIEAVMNHRELPITTIIRPHVDEPNSDIFKPPVREFSWSLFQYEAEQPHDELGRVANHRADDLGFQTHAHRRRRV
jgi:thiol-disulfide isomerase/thioredoxin